MNRPHSFSPSRSCWHARVSAWHGCTSCAMPGPAMSAAVGSTYRCLFGGDGAWEASTVEHSAARVAKAESCVGSWIPHSW